VVTAEDVAGGGTAATLFPVGEGETAFHGDLRRNRTSEKRLAWYV
jgi:hypothetical protein